MLQNQGGFYGRPLTEDELRRHAPSVFALTAHESRSDRFRPIPTIEIIRGLRKEGFEVFNALQRPCRDLGRKDYTKHYLRLRKTDAVKQVGDTFFEIGLTNGNDGTSLYDLFAALFRATCMNGMCVNEATIGAVKVRHTGDVMSKVIEGTYSVLQSADQVLDAPQRWGRIQLAPPQRQAYAEAAHQLRFADNEGNVTTPITPVQLLAPRRPQDNGTDLWHTFNVVQENLLKGGIQGEGYDANQRHIRRTTRAIKGIDQDVKLNRALWTLTNKMAELAA